MQSEIQIWGIKNCNTMKKAFEYLQSHRINYQFHDYKKEKIKTVVLEQLLESIPLEELLNKKSATWRALTDDEKQNADNESQAINLMQTYPTLIKRPVLIMKDIFLVGFSESSYNDFFDSLS